MHSMRNFVEVKDRFISSLSDDETPALVDTKVGTTAGTAVGTTTP